MVSSSRHGRVYYFAQSQRIPIVECKLILTPFYLFRYMALLVHMSVCTDVLGRGGVSRVE